MTKKFNKKGFRYKNKQLFKKKRQIDQTKWKHKIFFEKHEKKSRKKMKR